MILQSMKMAVKSIRTNRMRSFLTMLGIIIGVVALVVLVSLVSGASGQITESINSLGTDLISVNILDDHNRPVKAADLETLTDDPRITACAPVGQTVLQVSAGYKDKTATVYGTTGAYAWIQNLKVAHGRFLMKPDEDNHSNVAVINAQAAKDLFGRQNAVGETLRISGTRFLIIGVLEEEDTAFMSMMLGQYMAYVPYSALVRLDAGVGRNITSFYVKADAKDLDAVEEELGIRLKNRFDQDSEAFFVFNQSQIADAMDDVTHTLSLLLGGIAGISLLVGGIGIMNIMLVSVTERTREIGIRKAIGAGRGTIMLQFLIEALMVSLIGCAIGLIVSWIAILIIDIIGNVSYGMSPKVAVLSVLFSMGIGVLFGIYPANKAAKKKPIDALRYTG